MLAQDVKFLSRKTEQNRQKIAYMQQNGRTDKPGLVFLGGFRSDMTGTKANAIAEYAASQNLAYLRFDYFGHGQSSGDFLQGTLSYWRDEVLDILAQLTKGRQILIGSSFGGWLSLMMAEALKDKIAALVLIAPAVDMTHRLMWQEFSQAQRDRLTKEGIIYLPSEYDEKGYPITRKLIEDGKQYLMLDKGIAYDGPVRILHGQKDTAVPYTLSLELAEKLHSTNVETHFIKDGDHSLSSPANLALLTNILDALIPTL